MSSTTDIIAANSQQTGNRFVTRGLKHSLDTVGPSNKDPNKKLEALTSIIKEKIMQTKNQRQQKKADQQQHVQPKQPFQQPVFTNIQLPFRTWRAR